VLALHHKRGSSEGNSRYAKESAVAIVFRLQYSVVVDRKEDEVQRVPLESAVQSLLSSNDEEAKYCPGLHLQNDSSHLPLESAVEIPDSAQTDTAALSGYTRTWIHDLVGIRAGMTKASIKMWSRRDQICNV